MRIITTIIITFWSLAIAYSQDTEVRGVVLDKDDNSPIAGVIVQVKNSSDVTILYTITDDKGVFDIRYCNKNQEFVLSFQSMGYRPYKIGLNKIISPITVYLIPQPTQLKDVIVKAPDIEQRSDTLTYYMSKYAKAQDKNIADVLKRLPGIKVEENGEIKYNGEPINKFYIDGVDFMDGRYGLATENIAPSDVASVEVLENHQPIQVLRGLEFSQQAGLNIKLREEARHKWVGILNGGTGFSPLLYDASVFAMRIAGNWQNMETVRVNNTGWNPASQSQRHTEDRIFSAGYTDNLWEDYISVGQAFSPIDERRTRDNLSVLANTSNSWRVGDGKDIKFNLTYESDRLDYVTGYETNYFDENIASFTERNKMRTQAYRLGSQWAYQLNRPTLFLKDNFYIDAVWNKAVSDIGGTLSLSQRAKTPSFGATNDLQLVKRIDNHLLTISSRNRYIYKPQSLNIITGKPVLQDITTGDFRSVTEGRYGWLISRWSIYVRGGMDFDHHRLNSDLQGLEISYPTENDMNFSLLNTYISPEASYKSQKWLLTLSAPVYYHLYDVRNKTASENLTKNYIAIGPSFYLRYQINAKLDLAAQLKYSLTPPEAGMYVQNIFMTNFRDLYMSEPVSEYREERSAAFSLRYRNPITSLFFNLVGKFEWNHNPHMQNQLFIDDYILTTFQPVDNDDKNLTINGSLSKGLMSGRITLSLDAGYKQEWATSMRQNTELPYILKTVAVQPNLKGYFTKWFSVDYRLLYTNNALNINEDEKSNYQVLKQNLTFTFVLDTDWQIAAGGEHYYTRFSSGNSVNLVLLDASVRWSVSKRVDLSVVGMNLLNKREYRYASYGMLDETNYMYGLRGRNVMASIQIRL